MFKYIRELPEDVQREIENDIKRYYQLVGIALYSQDLNTIMNQKILDIMDLSDKTIECGLTWEKYEPMIAEYAWI